MYFLLPLWYYNITKLIKNQLEYDITIKKILFFVNMREICHRKSTVENCIFLELWGMMRIYKPCILLILWYDKIKKSYRFYYIAAEQAV